MFLRQSTSQVFRIGPFLDSTDGVTPEPGLTIANTDVDISKDGAAFVSKNSGGLSADGTNGWYSGTFDATDTTTVGILEVEITVSGALPVWHTYFVIEESIYDALYAAGSTGYNTVVPPSVSQFEARTIPSADYFDPAVDVVASVTLVATTTTNTDMVGTDDALLAANVPTNFASMVITAGGAVDSLLQGFLNTLITESSVGRITNNFDFFYGNADAQTTQVVDDVGGGGGGGTDWTASERNEIRGRLGVTGTTSAGGNTPTLSLQASIDALNDVAATDIVSDGNPISTSLGKVNAVGDVTGDVQGSVASVVGNVGGNVVGTVASVIAINTSAGAITLVLTTTTNSDMRGTDGANTVIPMTAALSQTEHNATQTSIGLIPTTAMRGTDGVDTAAMRGTDGANTVVPDPAGVAATEAEVISAVTALLTTQMAEAYAADGVAPTLAEALFLIQQTIGDFSIAGTTITTKRLNGTTTAATYELDDGATPTSRTRIT